MAAPDLLRLAEVALAGHTTPQLPEDLVREVTEETRSRAGVLRRGGEVVARWPRTMSEQVEAATEGWTELRLEGSVQGWSLRLLGLEQLDETVSAAMRLALRAFDLREELKQTRFDERFHLWELEAIRSIATSIGGILDPSRLAEELIAHLVALLGLRSAHLYLGPGPAEATAVAAFGTPVLTPDELANAWSRGLYRDEVVALPLQNDARTLGVLVAAHKEARAGTEPFASNDIRLLELFAVQVTVAMEHARLARESLERERLRQELEVAAAIQTHLFPQEFPELQGYRLAARSSPSRQVAGDTYDVLVRDGHLLAVIADVSGKGVGAGMIAAGVHAGVRLLAEEDRSLEDLAVRLNRYLVGATADNRFATFALAQLDRDGKLKAVNAGHCPILIRRASGRVEQVRSSGLPLGIVDFASYREFEGRLERGELVVLFTDGVSEATNADGEEFGVERVVETVAGLAETSADGACRELVEQVERHVAGETLQDDVTILVVERLAE